MSNGGKRTGRKTSGQSSSRKKSKGSRKNGRLVLNTPAAAILAASIIVLCVATLLVTNRLTGEERERSSTDLSWALPSEDQAQNPFVPLPDEKSDGQDERQENEPKKDRRKSPPHADFKESTEEEPSRKQKPGTVTVLPKAEVVLISSEEKSPETEDSAVKQDSVIEEKKTPAEKKEEKKSGESESKEEPESEAETQAQISDQKTVTQDSIGSRNSSAPIESPAKEKETKAAVQTRTNTQTKPPLNTVTERTNFPASSLPKKNPEKESAADFKIPKASPGAKICFVIDDAGLHAENVKKYSTLPFPLTIAVLPGLAESEESVKEILSSGKELILHQPMQAHDYPDGKTPDPGPNAVLPGMGMDEAASLVRKNLESLGPKVAGMNNHEGSLITENAELMGAVLSVAQEKKIYFLDSRTTSQSSVPNVAKSMEMTYIARFAPFLDNEIDRKVMLEMLLKGLDIANRDGYAVIIGHVDKSADILPNLLMEIYPALIDAGYTLTTPSAL